MAPWPLFLFLPTTTPKVPESLVPEDSPCPIHNDQASSPQMLSEYGHQLETADRSQEALACYALNAKKFPHSHLGWFDLASALQYQQRGRALKYMQYAVRIKPTADLYNQLGVLQRTSMLHADAITSFKNAARLQPNDATPHFHLGASFEELGDLNEALRCYRKSLDLEEKENEARILNNIGALLAKLNKNKEALAAFAEAEEADPTFPETAFNQASMLIDLSQLKEARKYLEAAKRLSPTDERIHARQVDLEKKELQVKRLRAADIVNKRDASLSKEDRLARFQRVLTACRGQGGKECMKEHLGQTDLDDDIIPIF